MVKSLITLYIKQFLLTISQALGQALEQDDRKNLKEITELAASILNQLYSNLKQEPALSRIARQKKEVVFLPYKYSMWDSMESIWRSVGYGIIAACIGTILALFVAYLSVKTNISGRSLPDLLVVLGGATPSIVIALALIITFSGNYGLNLYSTMWILVVSYLVKYMTMSVRTIAASLSQVHISLEEAALNSGASWIRTMLRITGPLILPSIAAGWFLIFIPCFYELSMTTLLYTSDTKTIGFQLYQYWTFTSQPQACAMAFGILLFVVILNFILNKLTKGEFTI